MSDAQAIQCFRQRDYAGRFRPVNAIWMVIILETLEDLAGGMSMDAAQWGTVLRQAGINVPRMEAALAAARAKGMRATDWTQFVARTALSSLVLKQEFGPQ
jgi:hypothetical protein